MKKEDIQKADFSKEADILKTIGHPVRLKIIIGLMANECCVKDIHECMDLPQPVVSQHLAQLRNRGIVKATRSGNRTIYNLSDKFATNIVKAVIKSLGGNI